MKSSGENGKIVQSWLLKIQTLAEITLKNFSNPQLRRKCIKSIAISLLNARS